MTALARSAAWLRARKEILAWALASRVVVLVCALFDQLLCWPRGFFGAQEFGHGLGILGSWDGRWYQNVAARGYLLVPGHQSNPAFFPLFPIVLRSLHWTGLSFRGAGVVVANLAFLVAVLAFYELGRELLPEQDARRAAVYLAVFPMGFVFSMVYPESLVFAAIALAAFFALRGRWIAAALAGAVAALARPEGVFYVLPLAVIVVRRRPVLTRRDRAQPSVPSSRPRPAWSPIRSTSLGRCTTPTPGPGPSATGGGPSGPTDWSRRWCTCPALLRPIPGSRATSRSPLSTSSCWSWPGALAWPRRGSQSGP